MNFIPYLFKKDFFRMRGLLLVWFLLVFAQAALNIGGINFAVEFLEFQMFLPLFTKFFGILQGLMIIVMVPLLIQEDSLVGTTAFWFSRPISRKGLLITKLCGILLFLVAFPLIVEIIVLAANGLSAQQMLLAGPEILLEKLAFIVPFLLLAVVTPRFSKYALIGIIIFAVLMVMGIIIYVLAMFMPIIMGFLYQAELYLNPSLQQSIKVATDIFVVLAGSILVIHQFLTRYTARTVRWFVVTYLIMMCFSRVWSWAFLQVAPVGKSTLAEVEAVSIKFDTANVIVGDEMRYRKNEAREKSISVKSTIEGLPVGQFAILKTLKNVRMKYPDGQVIESQYVSSTRAETFANEKFMAPLQAVLGETKLLNPFKENLFYSEIFSLDEAAFLKYKNEAGTYLGHADLNIYNYKISARVPLKQGGRELFGSEQIIIYDILEGPDGVSVIIAEKKINLLFDRTVEKKSSYDITEDIYSNYKHVYLIVNKKRKEAFLAEIDNTLGAEMAAIYGAGRLQTKAKQIDFRYINDRSGPLPKIDKEWLADAEFLRVDAKKIATQHKDFAIEGFSLPAQSTEFSEEADFINKQLRMQDKQMQEYYPGLKDKEEVEEKN